MCLQLQPHPLKWKAHENPVSQEHHYPQSIEQCWHFIGSPGCAETRQQNPVIKTIFSFFSETPARGDFFFFLKTSLNKQPLFIIVSILNKSFILFKITISDTEAEEMAQG